MDLVLLLVIVIGFTVTNLLVRHFFKQISDKISFTNTITEDQAAPITDGFAVTGTMTDNPLFKTPQDPASLPALDPAEPNSVMGQDLNDVEFSEQQMNSLPKDLKFEVEGGDSAVPPGFEEKKDEGAV